jgi:Lon protease-like protein
MAESLEINFESPIPIFPLPNCVLLPQATLPLHIFEPRYRAMIAEALDSRGLIGMACFEGEDWKKNYEQSPPIREHLCIGYIVKHEKLADGRYNVWLQGICRARVITEIDSTPYRKAIVRPTEMDPPEEGEMMGTRARLDELFNDPLHNTLSVVHSIHRWLTPEVPTTAVIDLASMAMADGFEERYKILVEADLFKRAEKLKTVLERMRKAVKIATRFEPEKRDDYTNLN